jgi:hypothetical protein
MPAKRRRGKGTKWMVVVDGTGVRLGDDLHSASLEEARFAETMHATNRVEPPLPGHPRHKPESVLSDETCDRDPLRRRVQRRGIE